MSSQVIPPNTEAAILARILQADEQELTPDGARYWLSIKLPTSDEERVNELSAKARAGSLTEAETQELDSYCISASCSEFYKPELAACSKRNRPLASEPLAGTACSRTCQRAL